MSDDFRRRLKKNAQKHQAGVPKSAPITKPSTTDADANALAKAKSLIEAKRFDDARAILITLDHPTADKWLERLSSIAPVKAAASTPAVVMMTDKSFTTKLAITVICLLFFFIPGIICLAIFGTEAKKYPDAPGAGALILLNRMLFWFIIGAIVLIVLAFILVPSGGSGAGIYTLF